MASEKTLAIRNIGRIKATRLIFHPNRTTPDKITRMFPSYKIGKVIHAGGQRFSG